MAPTAGDLPPCAATLPGAAEDERLLQVYTAARLLVHEQRIEAEIEAIEEAPEPAETAARDAGDCGLARVVLSAPGRTLEVRVSGLAGHLCTLRADASSRVRDVKLRVAKETKLPADHHRLFLGALELKDHDLVLEVTPPASPVADLSVLQVDPEWQRCLEMVSIAGMQLAVVPEALRGDRGIALAAARQNGLALRYAPVELRADREVVLAAVRDCGVALQFASRALRADREVVHAAVVQCGLALEFACPALCADREVVLVAVRGSSQAFQFAEEGLRADRQFVLAVVTEAGLALEFAGMGLRCDREVVLAAVRQDGLALEYATEALRADREVVCEAVKVNGLALWDAAEHLKRDPSIMAIAKWG